MSMFQRLFQRKVSNHFIRVDPNNVTNKKWLIVLEAGTIVGPSPGKLRVVRATQERKLVKKYNLLPLHEEEIGNLIAQALESRIKERRPWYLPSDNLPTEPAIDGSIEPELDTLVVDMPKPSSVAA